MLGDTACNVPLGGGVEGGGEINVDGSNDDSTSSNLSEDQLADMNRTASLLYEQGNLEEAKVLYRRALEGREKALGLDHPSTL